MRRRDERGAIALVTAAVMVVLLGVAAFVVDIGMQRVARQDLQALADVVALDLARMLDGRTAGEIKAGDPGPSLAEAKDDSQARNDDDTVGDAAALEVTATLLVPEDDGTGWRTADDDEMPEAVRVETSTTVDFGFAGAIGFGSGGAARTSIASARSSACFHLGSYAASIERDAGLLDPLNDVLALDLTLVEYRALAGADLSLDDLAEQPSIGSPSALLDGPLTLDELIAAVKVVLRAQPGDNAAAVAALDRVATFTDGELSLELREVLVVADDDVDALRTDINVLDLVGPALLSATGGRLLDEAVLDGTGLDNPPADGEVVVRPGAQRVCGVSDATEGAGVDAVVGGGFEFVRRGVTVTTEVSVDVALGGAEFALAGPAECRAEEVESDRYDVVYSRGSTTQSLTTDISLDGLVSQPPQDVVSIEFTDLTVEPALGLDVALGTPEVESPAGLEVPGNAINDRPDRGLPVTTGVALGEFDRLPRIPRAFMQDPANVEIVYAEGLDAEEQAAAEERAERRINFVRLLINLTLRNRTEVASDTVTTAVGSYADVLGAKRAGADLYSEVRPTCVGVRLVE